MSKPIYAPLYGESTDFRMRMISAMCSGIASYGMPRPQCRADARDTFLRELPDRLREICKTPVDCADEMYDFLEALISEAERMKP